MTALLRRLPVTPWRAPDDRVVLVAIGVAAVAAGVAGAVLGKAGLLVVGGLVGLCVGLVALVHPPVALLLVLLATFTRNAQKEILPAELVLPALVLMVVSVAAGVTLRAVTRPRIGAVEWLMLAFLAWNLLSVVIPHEYAAEVPANGEPFDLERWFLGAIVLPFAVYQGARITRLGDRPLRWFLWTVVAMTTYSTWVSIAQFHASAFVWPRYIVENPNWPGRANGIFNQPVVNGVVLVVGLVVCLYLSSRSTTSIVMRLGLYVLVAATAYAVYLTHTRAAVLSLAVVTVLGSLLARGWRRGFLVIGALGAIGLASQASTLFSSDRSAGGYGSTSEVYDRLNIAATGLHAIVHHPVTGVGVGRFGMYNTYEHQAWSDAIDWSHGQSIIAHENELGIGAEVGLPGLLMWLAIIVLVTVLLWQARRVLPDGGFASSGLAVVGLAALSVMVINGFTVDLRPLELTTTFPFLIAGVGVGRFDRLRDHVSSVSVTHCDLDQNAGEPIDRVDGQEDTGALPAHPRTNGHGAVSVR